MFKQGERVFLLSVSRCGISRRQGHVRGVTRWEGVILNYELVFGECFPFNIIWEIPAWPRKSGNCGEKLLPTRIQNWTRNFVHPLLNWMLTTNICPTHPTREALRKPCGRSAQVFHLHYVVLPISWCAFGVWYGWHVVWGRCDVNSQLKKADV